eukprot:SAG31_NODE_925_length_10954_cov_3.051589_2_plen_149_part_00
MLEPVTKNSITPTILLTQLSSFWTLATGICSTLPRPSKNAGETQAQRCRPDALDRVRALDSLFQGLDQSTTAILAECRCPAGDFRCSSRPTLGGGGGRGRRRHARTRVKRLRGAKKRAALRAAESWARAREGYSTLGGVGLGVGCGYA